MWRQIRTLFSSTDDSTFLNVKLKHCKRGDNKLFQLIQHLKKGETVFDQFITQKNQLVVEWNFLDERKNWLQYRFWQCQRYGWTTQVRSKTRWLCGPKKTEKYLWHWCVNCGQAREIIGSSPIICKEERGREELFHPFDVRNSVYG